MRLLDTTTYTLSEYQGEIPPYAILSHIWEQEEVTFSDIAKLKKAANLKGFAKIVGACKTALQDRSQYIWIDTCCINKESSAELSEAINSMFMWYKNAHVCYAYLSDVPSNEEPNKLHSPFAMSRWFTRGWTLQELLAPSIVVFHGDDWVDIGTKETLHKIISAVTGISVQHLVGFNKYGKYLMLEDVPVAVKMSWASLRLTTRAEDKAYSLMGLFGVSMPLLYGEGEKAFIRLQHEIIKASDDHSIFAFTGKGMLARSPSQFHPSGQVKLLWDIGEPQAPYSITNKGLHIQLPMCNVTHKMSGEKGAVALLNCCLSDGSEHLTIMLVATNGKGSYRRCEASELQFGMPAPEWVPEQISPAWQLQSIYIVDDIRTQEISDSRRASPYLERTLLITATVPTAYGELSLFAMLGSQHSKKTKHTEGIVLTENKWGLTCPYPRKFDLVFENPSGSTEFVITLGLSEDAIMWCSINTSKGPTERKYFLDRFLTTVDNKWAVILTYNPGGTSPLGRKYGHHTTIEIKCALTPQSTVAPERPHNSLAVARNVAWLVTPPAPCHGYTWVFGRADLFSSSVFTHSVPYHGSLVVYVPMHLYMPTVAVVAFEGSGLERPFQLHLGQTTSLSSKTGWSTAIMQGTAEGNHDLNNIGSRVVGTSYSEILEGGKQVYVSSWRSRDTSLADFVVKLSM